MAYFPHNAEKSHLTTPRCRPTHALGPILFLRRSVLCLLHVDHVDETRSSHLLVEEEAEEDA